MLRGRPTKEVMPMVKTSLALPEALWRGLKIAAVEERTDMQAIIARLVAEYLKRRKKKGGA